MRPKHTWPLLREAVGAWSDDYAPSMGAALSYYTLFSIAPLLLIVISVAGWFFGDQAVRGELVDQLRELMGADGAKAVEGLLASVAKPKEGALATLIGIAVLLFGATSVFGELQNALDRIWRAPAREVGSVWRMLRARLMSISMIFCIAFLLMVSLVFDAVLQALGKAWGTGAWEAAAQALNTVIAFGLTTTSAPAAPKDEATALRPMYRPMRNLPTVKRIAVTSAPTQTSCQAMRARGISR